MIMINNLLPCPEMQLLVHNNRRKMHRSNNVIVKSSREKKVEESLLFCIPLLSKQQHIQFNSRNDFWNSLMYF